MPADLDLHLICQNYATHKTPEVKKWLLRHPRFQLHFTPTSASWLNLVERWFAELTNRKLRRSAPPQPHRARTRRVHLDQRVEQRAQPVHLDQDRRRDPQHPLAAYCLRINNSEH